MSPTNHLTNVSISSYLDWSDCTSTDSYAVYFGTSSSPPYYDTTSSSIYYPILSYDAHYYWRIVAKNSCGGATSGSTWDFTTQSQPSETVSTPNTPTGSTTGDVGQALDYSTCCASSNLGHSIQYQFDWGDGTPYSSWSSSTTAVHSWSTAGTYSVRAQARCAINTSIVSSWSGIKSITITTWSFAIITDLHIGRGYDDYGNETYYLTDRLQKIVNDIRTMQPKPAFVAVLGDISNSGNELELSRAKIILDQLNDSGIPYLPLIGNHDAANRSAFNSAFGIDLSSSNRDLIGNISSGSLCYDDGDITLQNFAFVYRNTMFIALDNCDSGPAAKWYDASKVWLHNRLNESAGKSVVLFSHIPVVDPDRLPLITKDRVYALGAITSYEDRQYIYTELSSRNNIRAWFAGHVHGFEGLSGDLKLGCINYDMDGNIEWPSIGSCRMVGTDAVMVGSNTINKGVVRIVSVGSSGALTDSLLGEYPALNPYFYAPVGNCQESDLVRHFLPCNFTNRSISGYRWDFENDGIDDSTEEYPTHQYPDYRSYTVKLTLGDNSGKSEFITTTITVERRTSCYEFKTSGERLWEILAPAGDNVANTLQAVPGKISQWFYGLISHSPAKPVVAFQVNFENVNENIQIDLTSLTGDIDPTSKKSFFHINSWPAYIEGPKVLFIPSTGVGAVYICPNATSLDAVSYDDPNKVVIHVGETVDGMTVFTTEYDGEHYYMVYGVTGTGGGEVPDTTPPATVNNLAVSQASSNSVTLTWTAPGDDSDVGTASQYDIRYSTSPITDANWDSATHTGEPSPQPAGSTETFTVTGLSQATTYYFALKTADEVPNWSGISDVAVVTTGGGGGASFTVPKCPTSSGNPHGNFDVQSAYPGQTIFGNFTGFPSGAPVTVTLNGVTLLTQVAVVTGMGAGPYPWPAGTFEGCFTVPDVPAGNYTGANTLIVAASGLSACAPWFLVTPKVFISPTYGSVGTSVTITGRGYTYPGTASAALYRVSDGAAAGALITSPLPITVNSNGTLSATFTMPEPTTKDPNGNYTVKVTDSSGKSDSATFVVLTMAAVYVPDDYSTIQAAVDAASSGDTIIVRDGTYTENVDVNKSLTIRSENGANSTIVQAANPDDHVFYIEADYVILSGFTVQDAGNARGVYLVGVGGCTILGNTLLNNHEAVRLSHSSSNTIEGNQASNNGNGILLLNSSNNNVVRNNALDQNVGADIWLEWSDSNVLDNNTSGQIGLYYSHRNTLVNNVVTSDPSTGITLIYSNENSLTRNISSLNFLGIRLDTCTNNSIFLNDFIDSVNQNAWVLNSSTFWNSPAEVTYSYQSRTYTNCLGNYWSDYTGIDNNGDGIGDTPYTITAPEQDSYPLVEPFENYEILSDQVVTFPDPNLEAVIRQAIGKPTGDIYKTDLDGLTGLNASERGIVDLAGLEHCASLTDLDLWNNQIDDLTPLANLTNLAWLNLSWNQIDDLTPLANLMSLTYLNLWNNQISDISVLSNMTSLARLALDGNHISDISPIANLTSLRCLFIRQNPLGNISSVSGLTNLTQLYLGGNQISDINPVSNLTSLTVLELGGNKISALSPLSNLTSLTVLDLGGYYGGNQIEDISPLSNLTNLAWLSLYGNQISDISPISNFTQLTYLHLSYNHIADVSALSNLTNINILYLYYNEISDISALSNLTSLVGLYLGQNQISDILPLLTNTGLSAGDEIDLRGNPLTAVSLNTYIPQLEARGVVVLYDAKQPPVADAGSDQSVSSGDLVYFDGSNSYDPDGTIVTYGWEFGDGEAAKGCKVSHRFRGAMDESKTYTVTLTVEDNSGATATDSCDITVTPLEKTVEVIHEPAIPVPGQAVFARMTVSYNWIHDDTYAVSRIHYESGGFIGVGAISVWDFHSHEVPYPKWAADILSFGGEKEESYYPSLEQILYGGDTFEGIEVDAFDAMNIYIAGWAGISISIGPSLPMPFFETNSACFEPDYTEAPDVPIEAPSFDLAHLCSPGELRVYDSEGRVTGLVNGEIKEEIPCSAYKDNIIIILPSSDSYMYEVAGTDVGSYGLGVASVKDGETNTFAATDIPTSSGATHQYTIDWDSLAQGEEGVTLQIDSNGDGTFEQTITSDATLQPPVAEANGPYSGFEGSPIIFDGVGSCDPDGTITSYGWDFDDDGEYELVSASSTATFTYGDDYTGNVTLRVTDDDGLTSIDKAEVAVQNVLPIVGPVTGPMDPVKVNTPINVNANFTDPGILDTHTTHWTWDDGSMSPGTVNETNGSGTVSGSHTYTTPGVYTITLTVTDKDGGSAQSTYQYIVVYDPSGGFVTGGGWINSPTGAYPADANLAGKATFGFVSKYQKGATVPTGNTEFQFHMANLNFQSASYQWLVIAGAKAQYKGSGTINGAGDYGFMLTAIDGQISGGGGIDKFRIKIWNKATGDIIYDNQMGATDTANPTTAIAGGSIVIHK